MKIGIVGAFGRMGQSLATAVHNDDTLIFAGASVPAESPYIGEDISKVLGIGEIGTAISSDPYEAFKDCDGIIDFSTPETTIANAEFAAQARVVHVIGTTGMTDLQYQKLDAAARHATIIHAGNMSLGVNLLELLTKKVAATLGIDFDIEVIEYHHNKKVDAPSGTALMLGEAAAEGREVKLNEVADRGRDGITGERLPGNIGFSAIRGGDIIGEHDVLFAGQGERITLRHQATNRNLFASGAITALKWGQGKKPGLYNMHDVLGLDF